MSSEGSPVIRRGIAALQDDAYTFYPDGIHEYQVARHRQVTITARGVVVGQYAWNGWYADELVDGDGCEDRYERMVGTYDSVKNRPQSWPTLDEAVAACVLDCETEHAP